MIDDWLLSLMYFAWLAVSTMPLGFMLGASCSPCCEPQEDDDVPSCKPNCNIPASITVSLSYQSILAGTPTAGELSSIADIFDKDFVLDFDSLDLIGAAKYIGPAFPDLGGGSNVSLFDFEWDCDAINDPAATAQAGQLRIRRCGYGNATYDTAQSSFFGLADAPFVYITMKSQNAWCQSPENPGDTDFNMLFGTPTGSGCGVNPLNYTLIYRAALTI